MNKLEEARITINEVDTKIIELFVKRMAAAKMVAEYKKENNKPIYDAEREKILIEQNLKLLNNKELEKYYLIFLQGVLKASKDYQEDLIK